MSSFEIPLLSSQEECLSSNSKEVLFLAGIGSGKSHLGALWTIINAIKYPKSKGLIVANSYSQLVNASVETLCKLLEEFGIEYTKVLSGAKKHIKIGKHIIYLYSLEKYDNIRGIEVSYIWLDEAAFSKAEAIKVVKGRLRDKRGPLQMMYTSSPNGFNWMWEKFEGKDGILSSSKVHLVRGVTKDNIFLPEGYYEDLLEEYGGEDSPLAKQELFGQFVNMNGASIYWAFDRKVHASSVHPLDPKYPVYVGMDFNIEEMNAVMIQLIRGKFYVCERIRLTDRNANTYDMTDYLLTNYKQYRLKIIPDSTGSSRKTSAIAGQSDHKILEDAGLEVLKTKNPLIRNRQNNVNIKFKKNQLYINSKEEELIREIESLNARDKEGTVSHAAVTIGYVLWYLDPLKRVAQKVKSYATSL